MASGKVALALRITLVGPPPGVAFCIQGRNKELLQRQESTGEDLAFDVTVFATSVGKAPRLLGDVVQGPPGARFVYVCSGTLAGQPESCWTRRAKVPLNGILWPMIERLRHPTSRLEARIDGKARDGGPACASVELLGDGWHVP